MEIYLGAIKGEKLKYESNKRPTHAVMTFVFLAWLCLVIGLWPQFHFASLFVVALFGCGQVLPITLVMGFDKTHVTENILFFAARGGRRTPRTRVAAVDAGFRGVSATATSIPGLTPGGAC